MGLGGTSGMLATIIFLVVIMLFVALIHSLIALVIFLAVRKHRNRTAKAPEQVIER